MITGHLPAGYIAATGLSRSWPANALFAGVILGAVLPDIDMLWFYLVDDRGHHHHSYLTHRPALWALILTLGYIAKKHLLLIGLGLGGLLHVAFDTTLGEIAWAWPLSDHAAPFITVQPTHSHFLLSFMAHWTFALEILLWVFAAVLTWRIKTRP